MTASGLGLAGELFDPGDGDQQDERDRYPDDGDGPTPEATGDAYRDLTKATMAATAGPS